MDDEISDLEPSPPEEDALVLNSEDMGALREEVDIHERELEEKEHKEKEEKECKDLLAHKLKKQHKQMDKRLTACTMLLCE